MMTRNRHLTLLLSLLTVGLLTAATARGQVVSRFGFELATDIPVLVGADSLPQPWAGAFNSAAFAKMDFDGDGTPDLLVWDQSAQRVLTFLARPGALRRRWLHAPAYEKPFAEALQSLSEPATLVTLRDYDGDGRPDLWIVWGPQYCGLWRNVGQPGGVGIGPAFRWQYVTDKLREDILAGGGDTVLSLALGGIKPAIGDADGDGDVDILNPDFSTAPTLVLYRNTAVPGATPHFRQELDYGDITRCTGGANACFAYVVPPLQCRPGSVQHAIPGQTLLLQDFDQDGDNDLLIGQEYCATLTRLRNDGTRAAPLFVSTGIQAEFTPTPGGAPANVPQDPAAFLEDVTFDGRPDLLLTPWVRQITADPRELFDTRATAVLYTGTGNGAFQAGPRDFLQGEMLEVGENAAPTLADLDGDGDLDLLIGNNGDFAPAASSPSGLTERRGRLRFYRNTGTRTRPVFRLENADYGGFSQLSFAAPGQPNQGVCNLRPTLTDLDGNGSLDLVLATSDAPYGFGSQPLLYFLNTAPAGQLPVWPVANGKPFSSLIAAQVQVDRMVPLFTDVDGDGRRDLILSVGRALYYFRHQGGAPDTAFVIQDRNFGRLQGLLPSGVTATVADFDADGRPEILTADDDGELRVWPQLLQTPTVGTPAQERLLRDPLTTRFGAADLGQRLMPTAGDLDGDGYAELLVGTLGGGVRLLRHRSDGVSGLSVNLMAPAALDVFPNPATTELTVTFAVPGPVSVVLRDALGRAVRTASGAGPVRVSVAGLAPGLYVVQTSGTGGRTASRRVVVQP